MRRTLIATAVVTWTTFGLAATTSVQAANQPFEGESSTGGNQAGFATGPRVT